MNSDVTKRDWLDTSRVGRREQESQQKTKEDWLEVPLKMRRGADLLGRGEPAEGEEHWSIDLGL